MPVSVPPVKAMPATRGSPTNAAPTLSPSPGQKMQHIGRNARLMHQPHRARGDERRLLRGLRDHRVSGGERAGDLAGENGEREVPGRDAGEHAATVQRSSFCSPVGPLSRRGAANWRRASAAAVAEMIDGLAQIGLAHCQWSCRLRARSAPSVLRGPPRRDRRRVRGCRARLAARRPNPSAAALRRV